eukprot:1870116-Alexandrium_andersonii.AAC.1
MAPDVKHPGQGRWNVNGVPGQGHPLPVHQGCKQGLQGRHSSAPAELRVPIEAHRGERFPCASQPLAGDAVGALVRQAAGPQGPWNWPS